MELLCLDAAALRQALPMDAAIDAMRDAFRALADGTACVPQRCVLSAPEPEGTTLVMGGAVPEVGLAAKVVTVNPSNPARGLPGTAGLVVVLDPVTGVPAALLDGTWLTAWRTGAASGAATATLARSDARRALVVGAGTQARTQVLGLDAALRFERITVWARRAEAARALTDELADETRAVLDVTDDLASAVAGSEVIACATSATEPVLRGAWLAPGTHINAVGSFRPEMAELDIEAIGRSSVFVDTIEGALEEAGELLIAEGAGVTGRDSWVPLGQVLAGVTPGRADPDAITVFKSVGNAAQDVTAAAAALENARRSGLGTTVRL